MKLGIFGKAALSLAGSLAAVAALAQGDPDTQAASDTQSGLDLPANPQFLADDNPSIRKATAIVNGDVITGTDVDQRMALIILANGADKVPPDELQRLRAQVLRNLVDEKLEIQAAGAKDIKVPQSDIDTYYSQYAQNVHREPAELAAYLAAHGSSERSIKQQIRGEIAWSRLQQRQIEPYVNIADDEVQQVIDRLKASKGAQEYRIGEIFLSATPETADATRANADRIVQQLRQGASFVAYARQFSEASTAAVGGDLGWVRAEQLPDALAQAAQSMPVGQVSDPIAVPGGFSIIAVQDTHKVLTADPRDAQLSLKQIAITFPAGATQASAAPRVKALVDATQTMGGCGGAEKAAAAIGGEVVARDQMKVRDLPLPLQSILLSLNIGESTKPFGSVSEGVRVLVLCGRDDPDPDAVPSFDKVYAQMSEERVNRRAQRYLRDLRRDAVVDYR